MTTPPALPPRLDAPARDGLLRPFLARDMAGVNAALAALPGPLDRIRIDIVANARAAEAAPVWRVAADGTSRFRFHEKSWTQHPHEIFARWLDMLPLIGAALAEGAVGSCVFNLGDEGHRPGLAFDARTADFVLIPDYPFMMTFGYRDLARIFAERDLPWEARRPVAFWRGTTTGLERELDALPRMRLCRLARGMGARADVGFSSASQHFADAEPRLRTEGLFRGFVPNDRLDGYRLHVDIDGNSAPWTGLMSKLHSGSPVLKVTSPRGFRQWYYDRLVPWEHYVPVRSDMADLADKAAALLADAALAKRIGAAGQQLARAMTYEAEVRRAVPAIVAALDG